MPLAIVPAHPVLGAEIRGVDLADPLDDAMFAAIEAAYDQHGVIFFRDQHITPPQQAQMAEGKKLYNGACIACHEADGSGAPRIYPPLPGNANLQSADPSSTLRVILDGAQTVTTPRAPNKGSMPGYSKKFSDQEIADVTTYIRNSWGNAAPAVTPGQVAKARKEQ